MAPRCGTWSCSSSLRWSARRGPPPSPGVLSAPSAVEEALLETGPVLAGDRAGAQVPDQTAAVPAARHAADDTGARVPEERPHGG